MPSRADSDAVGTHLVKVIGVRAQVCVSGSRDERIAAIARWQRGRVAHRQLQQAGLTRGVISRAVQRGALFPLPGAVFAVGHAGSVELGEETAALLACPDGAVLASHTAAVLWAIGPAGDPTIHVLVPEGVKTRAEGFWLHRARSLQPQDIRIRKGLPVTSPARTLLDQANDLAPRQLELGFDQALVAGIMRLADVAELLKRTRGHRGAGRLRALLERQKGTTTVTRSRAEELFLDLVRRAHLPPPTVNARVAGYEVDFFWPEHKLIVEVDGFRFHSTRRAFEHDRRKEADLRAAGFIVLRVSFEQLERESYAVIADVARALAPDVTRALAPDVPRAPAPDVPRALAPDVTRAPTPNAQVATISEPNSREMATSTE